MKLPVIKINLVALIRLFKKLRKQPPLKHRFGFIPDKKDGRDIIYKLRRTGIMPASTGRANINEFYYRYDQGDIGACVGNGVVAAFRRVLQVNNQKDYDLSRLFAYWISREDKMNDTGAMIRDAFKAMNKTGICSETLWPYITKNFAVTPSSQAFIDALDHQTITYERVPQTQQAIMDAVYNGYPVVYGKAIYSSFMSDYTAKTGKVKMPRKCLEEYLGGHCMVIFDYDEQGTVELNSWGKNWGQAGICEVPWKYVLNHDLCQDFWAITKTE